MKEALNYMVNSLASNPKDFELIVSEDGDAIRFKIALSRADRGKLIGKEGRIIKSIRSFFQAIASKDGKKVFVDIV